MITDFDKFNEDATTNFYAGRKLEGDEFLASILFNKYSNEYDEQNISKSGLKKSLEMIGSGEVIDKDGDGDNLMYKEMLDDNERIFIVHGRIGSPVNTRGYTYQITLWKNDPRTEQIGGGYGTSGIITTNHTNLFNETGGDQKVRLNENIISKVCDELRTHFKKEGYTK